MTVVVFLAALCAAPLSHTAPISAALRNRDTQIATRLTAHIISLHKKPLRKAKVAAYAATLAQQIVTEARRNKIPVTTLAAIAWAESWFWRWVKGTSHEYGIWQLWPYSDDIKRAWKTLRAEGRIGTFPDRPWGRLGYQVRKKITGSIVVGTALAALVLKGILQWCQRKHRVYSSKLLGSRRHRYETDRAAHYNSGRAWPKPGYYFQLRKYSRTLRRALYGPFRGGIAQ